MLLTLTANPREKAKSSPVPQKHPAKRSPLQEETSSVGSGQRFHPTLISWGLAGCASTSTHSIRWLHPPEPQVVALNAP